MAKKRHTTKVHFVVIEGESRLVCDNGPECCSWPAGKYEMSEVFKAMNDLPEEAQHDE